MAKNSYSAGNLELQIQAVGTNATASLSSVNRELKTMKELVGKTSSLFGTMDKTSQKSRTSTIGNITGLGNNFGKSLSFAKLLGRLYFIRNYTKQIGRGIAGLVQNAIDYTETLNLWQVAMRGNRQEAERFVETMNKAYGISEQTLMNYQATFKNMLSALGGISDATSYALSEYLTQMALDYASLYNTSIEKAMSTFQSVLSGQVRPIRSISGYDITETTIFQLYQQLGGEKTMRQLSQTEKRLLRIYAVFQQMENSGTIGDLNKTLDNSANQLRILSESTKELGMWLGIIMEQTIKPMLPYLNAIVITLKNIIQAIAIANGYKPFDGAIESAAEFNEELDKVTGKLLSFDRFESLNSSKSDNMLGIDTALLAGLSKYESILANVTNQATILAEKWSKLWIDDETGELTERAENLLKVLGDIAITLGVVIGYNLVKKLVVFVGRVLQLNNSMGLLNSTIKLGIVFSLYQMISAFRDGNEVMGTVYAIITGSLLVAYGLMYISKLKNAKASLTEATAMTVQSASMQQLTLQMTMQLDAILLRLGASSRELDMIYALSVAETKNTATRQKNTITMKNQASTMSMVSAAISSAVIGFTILDGVINSFDGSARKTVSIISMIAGALATVLGIILAIKGGAKGGLIGASIAGLGVGALVAGIKGVATKNSEIQYRRAGGLIEDGLFTMNKKEMAGTFNDGTTVVANNQQIVDGIKQGVYSAVVSAMNQTGNRGGIGNVYLDKRKVGIVTAQSSHNEMVRTSLVRANS